MEKIWLKSYKSGIPEFITMDHTTINDLFKEACRQYAHDAAFMCHDVSITFAEVAQVVAKISQGLHNNGIKQGDRVALILPNSLQYPLAVFAILALGAVVVSVNPLYTAPEIEYVISNAQPKLVIVLDMFADRLNNFHNKHGISNIVITNIADMYPWLKKTAIKLILRYYLKQIPATTYQSLSWQALINNECSLATTVDIKGTDLAFIQYTGATTGHPKGAMLSHNNIVANVKQVLAMIEPQVGSIERQIVICALPLYHIFSLTANLLVFFTYGSLNIMIPNAKDIKYLVKTMNKYPFTVFNALDTLYRKLLDTPAFTNVKHSSYRYGICGGMPTRNSVAADWFLHTGFYPTNCYGLSETSPCVTMSFFDEEFSGAVGYPAPSTEIDIRDLETSCSLGINQNGVIFVRGPQVMSGYWHDSVQTDRVLSKDGWFDTGDIGMINDQGQLIISSRKTEMIIISGFNVYPIEVELAIDELPEVKEVAVIALTDEAQHETLAAVIALNSSTTKIDVAQIISHCRTRLARYKIPKKIFIADELPKTIIGKIDKKTLVSQYNSN